MRGRKREFVFGDNGAQQQQERLVLRLARSREVTLQSGEERGHRSAVAGPAILPLRRVHLALAALARLLVVAMLAEI